MTGTLVNQPETYTLETVHSILKRKGSAVWSIHPDATVYEAIRMMDEKGAGALVVVEAHSIAGLISERDYARNVALKGRQSRDTPVRDIMTSSVVTVTPEHRVDECMKIMTDRRIRHLPVVDRGKLVGLVSIGDLVQSTIAALSDTVTHLNSYITGEYPG